MINDYQLAAQWIKEADGILITAGAGMGVDSGLPDFRGDQGMWKHYPALGKQGMSFSDIADPQVFISDPKLAWGFYGHRLQLYRDTIPHNGFYTLNKWGQSKKHGAFVFTSNVDGHFQKAGFTPDSIYECHGSIHHMQCCDYCDGTWPADTFKPEIDQENCQLISQLPACVHCGYTARPNIVMFSDPCWQGDRYWSQQTRYKEWLKTVGNLVVIELGAGVNIPTVRHESERRAGKHLIRINPRAPQIPTNQGISFSTGALQTIEIMDT